MGTFGLVEKVLKHTFHTPTSLFNWFHLKLFTNTVVSLLVNKYTHFWEKKK